MYEKINFKNRIDTKPDTYLVDGNEVIITKYDNGLTQKGTSLNAENLNHMEDGIYNLSMELKENATKEVTLKDSTKHLDGGVDGILNINSIGGNTLYKREDGTYTDEWESGCTLESVGELEGNKIEVLSRGKNLINIADIEKGWINIYDGLPMVNDDRIMSKYFISVLPLTSYVFSKKSDDEAFWIWCYDVNKQFISYKNLGNDTNLAFTTPVNCIFIKYSYAKTFNIVSTSNLQLEEGTTATPYEPYREDKLNILSTLRGLPNGVRDIARGSDISRKIGKRAYQTGDEVDTELLTDKTNTYYELEEPIIEKIELIKPLKCWQDGSLITNSNINPVVNFKYPTNLNSRVSSVEENTLNNSNFVKEQNAVNLEFDFRITALENKEGVV